MRMRAAIAVTIRKTVRGCKVRTLRPLCTAALCSDRTTFVVSIDRFRRGALRGASRSFYLPSNASLSACNGLRAL